MIGRTLAHYQITAALGQGGMGAVYRATDTRLGREVALKVLSDEMAADPDRLARFQREAKALAALDHPDIVTVYSVEEADGVHFLTMQLVPGRSLDEIIADGPLPADSIRQIGTTVADALGAAHQKGIIHRDLKPANIIVTGEGRAKVLDFGLARMEATAPISSADQTVDLLTREGAVMGTLPYMSPEQVMGRSQDHRTDIFSLGVVLYEMACGKRPFTGDSAAELGTAIMRDAPPPLAAMREDLPAELAKVVSGCIAKSPETRYESMDAVSGALRQPAGRQARESTKTTGRRVPTRALLLVAIIAVLTAVAWRSGVFGSRSGTSDTTTPEIHSLAVLPLDNYSGDPTEDYFAEGMTDELTAYLARISQLRVISRGSAMQFKGADRPPTPEIARQLKVDAVVEGSVLRDGDRVRITVQLIDARADRHLWAESFERSSQDILALQDELASAIASAIHVQLTPAEKSRLRRTAKVDPEAYDAYLKGRYFFNRPSDTNLQKAIARFEEALQISPDFVPALSGLSDAYLWAGYNEGFLTASEARPKAKRAAEQAIRLDADSAEAHTSLATFKVWYEYDWDGAEAEYRRAFALNPSYAFAHDQFAMALAFKKRFPESSAESGRAAELDPLNPQIPLDASIGRALAGDIAGAQELVRQSEELDPTYFFPQWSYGWIKIQGGRVAESIPHFEAAKKLGAPAFGAAWLTYAYYATGDTARAETEYETLQNLSLQREITPFNLAVVALGRGENARALSYLEQAHASDSQWLGWLSGDRVFDPLRAEPRFLALLAKVRLND